MLTDDDIEARPQREAFWLSSVLTRHIDSLTVLATTAVLSLSLYIHLGVVFPIVYPKAELDKKHPSKANFNWQTCNSRDNLQRALDHGDDCACWDGLYKGSYGVHGRHAIFFNVQRETLGIFSISCLFICLAFVTLQKFFKMLLRRRLRVSAFLIILCNAHSMYYHWWVTLSYLNEAWYHYWWSQWVFGLTEAAVMYVLLLRIDTRFKVQCAHAVTVVSVAIFHMSQGLLTQAVKNMIKGCEGVTARCSCESNAFGQRRAPDREGRGLHGRRALLRRRRRSRHASALHTMRPPVALPFPSLFDQSHPHVRFDVDAVVIHNICRVVTRNVCPRSSSAAGTSCVCPRSSSAAGTSCVCPRSSSAAGTSCVCPRSSSAAGTSCNQEMNILVDATC
jgi:hypothetical protein